MHASISHSAAHQGQQGCTATLRCSACTRGMHACLQDDIAPFPTEEAFAVVEEDLQRPIHDMFLSISATPVAAASLGQVYKATLKADGSTVAVKVRTHACMCEITHWGLIASQHAMSRRGRTSCVSAE
jgi:hypothetical protein